MEASASDPYDVSPTDIWILGILIGYQIPQSRINLPPLIFEYSFVKIFNTRILDPRNNIKQFTQQVENIIT